MTKLQSMVLFQFSYLWFFRKSVFSHEIEHTFFLHMAEKPNLTYILYIWPRKPCPSYSRVRSRMFWLWYVWRFKTWRIFLPLLENNINKTIGDRLFNFISNHVYLHIWIHEYMKIPFDRTVKLNQCLMRLHWVESLQLFPLLHIDDFR